MVDRGRIGRSCGVWLFSGGCLYVGVLGKGLVVVLLWTCGGGVWVGSDWVLCLWTRVGGGGEGGG